MRTYIQHKWGNAIHIVRDSWESGVSKTYCGKWYSPSMSFTPDLRGEHEEDVVCAECRRILAAAANKRVYSRPTLRKGLSEAKRYKLRKAHKAYQEQQKLEAWNRAAQQERTP